MLKKLILILLLTVPLFANPIKLPVKEQLNVQVSSDNNITAIFYPVFNELTILYTDDYYLFEDTKALKTLNDFATSFAKSNNYYHWFKQKESTKSFKSNGKLYTQMMFKIILK